MNRVSLALLIVGVAAVCYGVWLILPAAGFISGGVLAVAAGVLLVELDGRAKP